MRFKEEIQRIFIAALKTTGLDEFDSRLVLEKPKHKEHGDICTPIALSLARSAKRNPMEIADEIAKASSFGELATVEVAKPGYINLRLSQKVLIDNLGDVDRDKESFGSSTVGSGVKCQVEYVSANPTGPLVVVSARAAAVGSVIVNLLRFAGFDAEGEYYVNDYGNQVRALGESLRYRVKERFGDDPGAEAGAYPGEYLKAVAAEVTADQVKQWDAAEDPAHQYGRFASEQLLEGIKSDLQSFGVEFNGFFRESSLHPDKIQGAYDLVSKKGFVYKKEDAEYFRTSEFGDEKDRVLVKSDGNPTYFLGDIAYHRTKLDRGFDWVIDLLGPDHHGHIPRMQAAASVLGAKPDWLQILTVGWVRLLEGDKPVSMSKRAGEFITLRELIEDVNNPDVAKYFFLMRRANSPLDFDLELARKQSDENPVYYVQYAHARISSVIRFAEQKGVTHSKGAKALTKLSSPEERELMVHLLFFPYAVEEAALSREPHRLTVYARELATLFHQFYHAHRIVTDDGELSNSRLFLVQSTQQVLKNTLTLLGVGAPSSM